MELGDKGSFQAVKLQRFARTTVCSHSTKDMAAIHSIESKHDNDDTQDECLSSCEQLLRLGQIRTSGRHVLGGQLPCGLKIGPRIVAHKINISALDISPGQLYVQLLVRRRGLGLDSHLVPSAA